MSHGCVVYLSGPRVRSAGFIGRQGFFGRGVSEACVTGEKDDNRTVGIPCHGFPVSHLLGSHNVLEPHRFRETMFAWTELQVKSGRDT